MMSGAVDPEIQRAHDRVAAEYAEEPPPPPRSVPVRQVDEEDEVPAFRWDEV